MSNFQGQTWNLLYLSQRWSNCHETKKQTYRLNSNVTIGFDLGHDLHDLDYEFSSWSMEFAISQPKMVQLPRTEKQIFQLNSRPEMWPIRFDVGNDLDLGIFRLRFGICYISSQNVWLPWNEKQTYWLKSRPQWPSSLTLAMTLKSKV